MIMDGMGTFFVYCDTLAMLLCHIHLGHISLVKMMLKNCFQNRQIRNQHLSSCNDLWNNILSGLMFKYSCVTKDITCLI